MKKYYAEIISKERTMLTKKYASAAELLTAMSTGVGLIAGCDVRFYNIEYLEDGTQLLHNGL